ncbi:nucleobase:cation symporter-2 family protein [Nocardiopsis suaedae]|uniref:Nucleobase:cation symporter-2 family protein n=1 Tax=Nocardiopsis suaedae TaxID=3018444 RepID=A0ABT4TI10_9ACTN|nr:nucleobase:cation symporter-2 family protein [Nocardiopsis suaedae]MDA2804226.1 nucleobase:cation symporter-2 family protein [Nocardiopsis suaedae]
MVWDDSRDDRAAGPPSDSPEPPASAASAASAVSAADERHSAVKTVLFGLQHVLIMYAGVVIVPIVVGAALGLDDDAVAVLVSIDLVLAGAGTLLQSLGLWKFGIRMPLVVGAASNGIIPMVLVGGEHGLPTVYGSLLVGGTAWILLAPLFGTLLRLFPAVVTGTVIALIGLTLIPVGLRMIVGDDPDAPGYGSLGRIALAAFTVALIVVLRRLLKGVAGQLSILFALVAGAGVGWSVGMGDLGGVGAGPVAALPGPLHFGAPQFHLPSILLFMVIILVITVEASGQGVAVGRVVGRPVGPPEIARLLRVDGLMTALSGVFSGFVYTTFGQNIGLIALTGVRSRFPVAVGGVILIVLGVFRPVGEVFAAFPEPVIGAAAVVTFGALVVTGVQLLAAVDFGRPGDLMTVMVSLSAGLVPAYVPEFYTRMPDLAGMFLESGVATGTALAVVLNLLFNGGRADAREKPEEPEDRPGRDGRAPGT